VQSYITLTSSSPAGSSGTPTGHLLPSITTIQTQNTANVRTKKYLAITGDICLETFGPTLFKGTRVYGTQEFREKFARISQSRPVAGEVFEVPIIRYRGKKKNPLWMDVEQEKFETIARISADTSKAPCTPVMYRPGFPFFVQELEAIYIYGQTEFKAQIAWTEWGMEKCSDAAVLYDNDGKDKER